MIVVLWSFYIFKEIIGGQGTGYILAYALRRFYESIDIIQP